MLASRIPPGAPWLRALEWQGLFRVLHLREMPDADAIAIPPVPESPSRGRFGPTWNSGRACGLAAYGPTAKGLGFEVIEGASVTFDGVKHHLAVLDFGAGSIDAWLAGLVAAELGVKEGFLDLESREIMLDERRVSLTLSSSNCCYPQDRGGKAVGRAELLEQIWRRRPDSSSNIDVVVRSLGKNMGSQAERLAAVRGFAYRLQVERRGAIHSRSDSRNSTISGGSTE